MENTDILASRLEDFLVKAGMSNKDLADYLNVPAPRISELKSGKLKYDRFLLKLYRLGLNPDWLMTGKGDMFADSENGNMLKNGIFVSERKTKEDIQFFPPLEKLTIEQLVLLKKTCEENVSKINKILNALYSEV